MAMLQNWTGSMTVPLEDVVQLSHELRALQRYLEMQHNPSKANYEGAMTAAQAVGAAGDKVDRLIARHVSLLPTWAALNLGSRLLGAVKSEVIRRQARLEMWVS